MIYSNNNLLYVFVFVKNFFQFFKIFFCETLKYVEQALESKELESFFTMKRVKKNLGGEDGENPPDDSTNNSAVPSNPQP